MEKSDLKKNYQDNFNRRKEKQTKWERAVEGLMFDRLEKKKVDYSLKRKIVKE